MVRETVKYPSELLTTVCEPVTAFDADLRALVADMLETMYFSDGIGLAAPQIGVLKRVVVIDVSKNGNHPLVIINPTVIHMSKTRAVDEEGCLSMPGLFLNIERPSYIQTIYFNERGVGKAFVGAGITARCIQHEVDHLDGILFTHRATAEELMRQADGAYLPQASPQS